MRDILLQMSVADRIALVRASREIFGDLAARQFWEGLGLPLPPPGVGAISPSPRGEQAAGDCLRILMTAKLGEVPVAHALRRALTAGGDKERAALRSIGLRVDCGEAPMPDLWVANQHPGLDRIYAGTPWSGKRWRLALLGFPGARAASNSVRFDGRKSRFIMLPAALFKPEFPSSEARSSARR